MSQELFSFAGRMLGQVIANEQAGKAAERERIARRPPLSSFHEIPGPLAAERWHDGRWCQVGYPWGWWEPDISQIPDADPDLVFQFQPERYDHDPTRISAFRLTPCSVESLLDSAHSFEADSAQARRLTSSAPLAHVLVGGGPGLIAQLHGRGGPLSTESVGQTELLTVHDGWLYQAGLYTTEQDHLAYQQVFWSVIATWRWK